MRNKQKERIDKAQKNLERIQETIAPFVEKKQVDMKPPPGRWTAAKPSILKTNPQSDTLTRSDFFKVMEQIVKPASEDE